MRHNKEDRMTGAKLPSSLDIAQLQGQETATLLLLEEVLLALVGAGVVGDEQVEGMLTRASAEVDQMCLEAAGDSALDKRYSAADVAEMKRVANAVFSRIRGRLTTAQS
jgi:hypothetical protein